MNEIINNEQCHDLLVYFHRPNDLKHLKYAEVFNKYNWSYKQPQRLVILFIFKLLIKLFTWLKTEIKTVLLQESRWYLLWQERYGI